MTSIEDISEWCVEAAAKRGMDEPFGVVWWSHTSARERYLYLHAMMDRASYSGPVFRVEVLSDGTCLSLWMFQETRQTTTVHASIIELPQWAQDRMLMLDMMRSVPMTDREIDGIGLMITENVYWVYPDKEDENGDDT